MSEKRNFDIIVWGATGFTGRLVAEYLTVHAPKQVKFAIAGRSKSKLAEIANMIKPLDKVDRFASGVPTLVADSSDQKSLDALVAQAKVIITTVGPYAKYVDACVRHRTHYLDLTGEPHFVKKVIDLYHDKAVENKTLIINSSGFDSVPSDIGTLLIANHFKSKGLSTNNVRYSSWAVSGGVSGGTLASGTNMIDELSFKQLMELNSNPDYLTPKQPNKSTWTSAGMYYDKGLKVWQFPFIMEVCNLRNVRRSNYLLDYGPNFQYCEGTRAPNVIVAAIATVVIYSVTVLMLLKPFRRLISYLVPPGTGPNEKTRKNGHFTCKLYGEATDKSGKNIGALAVVKGVEDPGYGETSKMISEAALTLVLDQEKFNDPSVVGQFKLHAGGVVTPASAMGLAYAIRLRNAGMTFSVSDA
ncbi:hypothetical protein HK103_000878 [Boothiomyces macroporosus]|uniref:Saccharopine dehydrogenase NADP binding domain-containing protein n=1 Tax=Boothiomyces macroporosus TaxID=261099 RepID=A0AAD5Y594_9FUNG|nr:hypothetical protein HK103_000878 [Boothiomyces macroporosus]